MKLSESIQAEINDLQQRGEVIGQQLAEAEVDLSAARKAHLANPADGIKRITASQATVFALQEIIADSEACLATKGVELEQAIADEAQAAKMAEAQRLAGEANESWRAVLEKHGAAVDVMQRAGVELRDAILRHRAVKESLAALVPKRPRVPNEIPETRGFTEHDQKIDSLIGSLDGDTSGLRSRTAFDAAAQYDYVQPSVEHWQSHFQLLLLLVQDK